MKKSEFLLPIGKASRACSVSRSTLMRYEKDGLLTPAHIDEISGYRYYDYYNLIRVSKILSLKKIGMSVKEIRAHFEMENGPEHSLKILEDREYILHKAILYLKMMNEEASSAGPDFYDCPDCYCYVKTMEIRETYFSVLLDFVRDIYMEVLDKGYSVNWERELFLTYNNPYPFHFQFYDNTVHTVSACIPVYNQKPLQTGDTVKFVPGIRGIRMLMKGRTEHLRQIYYYFMEKVNQAGTEVSGKVRLIVVSDAIYVKNTPGEDSVFLIALPLAEKDEK